MVDNLYLGTLCLPGSASQPVWKTLTSGQHSSANAEPMSSLMPFGSWVCHCSHFLVQYCHLTSNFYICRKCGPADMRTAQRAPLKLQPGYMISLFLQLWRTLQYSSFALWMLAVCNSAMIFVNIYVQESFFLPSNNIIHFQRKNKDSGSLYHADLSRFWKRKKFYQ